MCWLAPAALAGETRAAGAALEPGGEGAYHDDVCERVGARSLLRDLLQSHHVAPATERVAAADRHDVRLLAAPPELVRKALSEGHRAVLDVLTLGNLRPVDRSLP